MVRIRWKLSRGRVYLNFMVLGESVYYWFPKRGHHKKFHPRSIFTRQINHSSYKDPLIPRYVGTEGWEEGEIEDEVIKKGLKIQELTWEEFYDQLGKACVEKDL
jgi:hypothetical protein